MKIEISENFVQDIKKAKGAILMLSPKDVAYFAEQIAKARAPKAHEIVFTSRNVIGCKRMTIHRLHESYLLASDTDAVAYLTIEQIRALGAWCAAQEEEA